MSQINVNVPPPEPPVERGSDRTAAAGINMITVLIVLAVLAVVAWYLFTGPLRSLTAGTGAGNNTNITVNAPTQAPANITINPPADSKAPAQANTPAAKP